VTKHAASKNRALQLEEQLCFALYSASRAVTRAYQPLLAPLGLTYPQYLAMLVLWEGSALSVSELGARLSLDSGTLTPLLKRLEESELVERRRSETDERVVLVSLTRRGAALRERAQHVPLELVRCTGFATPSGISELEQLRESLRALEGRVKKALED
jgi:DNA-binding MarR family transcriptional regulator